MNKMIQITNLRENGYGQVEGEFFCECLNCQIDIAYDKNLTSEYVDKAIKHLCEIYPKLLNDLCKYTLKYCKTVMKDYPEVEYKKGLYQIKNTLEVLKYIEFGRLKIRNYNESIALNISGGCDWADEKGLQWIIQNEEIVYVGPWYDFDIDSPDLDDPFFNYCVR